MGQKGNYTMKDSVTIKKLSAVGLSLALAATMVAFPMAAFANESALGDEIPVVEAAEYYYVDVVDTPNDVLVGASIDFGVNGAYFEWPENLEGMHMDFKVTSGTSVGSINKHSGLFTALASGEATVTAYLVEGDKPSSGTGSQANPDGDVLAQNSLEVTVTNAIEYGFQGADITIMMQSTTLGDYENAYSSVSYVSGDAETGYVDNLGTLTADGDYYYFTVEMTNGFRDYNTPELFAARNANNIKVLDSDGYDVAVLNADNTGLLTVYATNHNSKTFTLRMAKNGAPSNGQLLFLDGFKGNNNDNSLGTTVAFDFEIPGNV